MGCVHPLCRQRHITHDCDCIRTKWTIYHAAMLWKNVGQYITDWNISNEKLDKFLSGPGKKTMRSKCSDHIQCVLIIRMHTFICKCETTLNEQEFDFWSITRFKTVFFKYTKVSQFNGNSVCVRHVIGVEMTKIVSQIRQYIEIKFYQNHRTSLMLLRTRVCMYLM